METPWWIMISAAMLSPLVAIVGVAIAHGGYRLARRRRADDLFDRRYEFYQRVRSIWLRSGNGAPPGFDPQLYIEDLIPIAEEASFLFDTTVVEHILSLEGPGHQGAPFFPDEDFIAPFRPYLVLEPSVSRLRAVRNRLLRPGI